MAFLDGERRSEIPQGDTWSGPARIHEDMVERTGEPLYYGGGVIDEEISLYQKENMGPYQPYSRVQRGKLQGASSPIQLGVKRAEKRRQEAGDQQRLARWEDLLKEERRGRLEWVKRWLKSENQFQSNRSVDLGDPGLDQRPSKEDKGEERRVEARELGRKDNPRKGSKVKEALADSGWGSAGANSEEELRKEVATKDEIVESLLSDNAELKEKVFMYI